MSKRLAPRSLIGATFGLMIAACTSHSSPSAQLRPPARAATGSTSSTTSTITVLYAATSRSSPADHASVIYANPTDGVDYVIEAPAAWSETWQVPAHKTVVLRVEVVGPSPASNSCAIRIDGKLVNAAAGQAGLDADTPVICFYAWPVENT
jgi:hypothetical protein